MRAQHDENVYGKVGCSAEAFEKALKGKKVLDAKQQGKYFWYVLAVSSVIYCCHVRQYVLGIGSSIVASVVDS